MFFTIQNEFKASNFSFLFQNLKTFTDNLSISFNKNKLYFQSTDSANITIFELNIVNDWFDEFDVNTDVSIGINTNILAKILSTREKGHTIKFEYNENHPDNLSIYFDSNNKEILKREFEIPLVDIEVELMQIPEQETNADIQLSSVNFSNVISQLKLFGDYATIKCNEEIIEFTSHSVETGKMKVNIDINDLNEYSITEDMELNMSYTLNYLNNISTFSKLTKNVFIHITEDFPIKIIYYLDDTEDKEKSLCFYLAPMIDNIE
jgi:proliferating cell nuclear antigen PCNA